MNPSLKSLTDYIAKTNSITAVTLVKADRVIITNLKRKLNRTEDQEVPLRLRDTSQREVHLKESLVR